MDHQDLAFVADALLALCEPDEQRPFYTSDHFRRRMQWASGREPEFARLLQAHGGDPLVASEYDGLIARARLTPRQFAVLQKRLDGQSFEDIARRDGHSKQGAQSIFVQALKKLARALHVYPFRGLSEVYRAETRRGVRGRGLGKMQVQVFR